MKPCGSATLKRRIVEDVMIVLKDFAITESCYSERESICYLTASRRPHLIWKALEEKIERRNIEEASLLEEALAPRCLAKISRLVGCRLPDTDQ